MIELHRTDPVAEGRYLTFTTAEGAQEWSLPVILLWYDVKWRYEYSKTEFPRKVYARSDMLPVGRIADLFPEEPQEYDL